MFLVTFFILVSLVLGQSFPDNYKKYADEIIASSLKEKYLSFEPFEFLCDTFGPRFVGTTNLQNGLDWLANTLKKEGLNVTKEPVHGITNWKRNEESLTMLEPRQAKLAVLGLGTSIGGDITGEVVVVTSFDDLKNNAGKIKGKIVVYNAPWVSYSANVQFRSKGAAEAAKFGAIGVLVRSITPFSLYSPHTGTQSYENGVPKIPAASITVEDAEMFGRMYRRGQKIVLRLTMGATTGAPVSSANLLVEITGKEKPNEVVVLGGHSDSWDVGQGAIDDGGGIFSAWASIVLLQRLIKEGVLHQPRRTIRVVFWVDEEVSQGGSNTYFQDHKHVLRDHVIAMESDQGNFCVTGLGFTGLPEAKAILQLIGNNLLSSIGTGNITDYGYDSDTYPLVRAGVPGGSLKNCNFNGDGYYFYFHHSAADYVTHINKEGLRVSVATFGVFSYVLADMEKRLPSKLLETILN